MYKPKNCKKCGGKMQAGGSPSVGLTHGPSYSFGPLSRPATKQDSLDYRYNMNLALQDPQFFEQRYVDPAFRIAARMNTPTDETQKWLDIGLMNRGALQDAQRDLNHFGPNALSPAIPLYVPKDTVTKPKKQTGGMAPRQQDYPDYESWQAAMDQWTAGQQEATTEAPNSWIPPDPTSMNAFDNIGMQAFQPTADMTSSMTWDPMSDSNTPTYASAQRNPPRNSNPYNLQNIAIGTRAIRTGLGEIAGRIERGRQNQYDYQQQTALGQMNPMQVDDFQPNPYNLYAQMGGNLPKFLRDYKKFTNNAQMDMGDGKLDNKGKMKKGGYEIDRMLIVRKLLPELLKLGRLGSGKYRNYQVGGQTIADDILRNPANSVYNIKNDHVAANLGNKPNEFSMNKQLLDDVYYVDNLNQAIATGQIPQHMRTSINPELFNYLNVFNTRTDIGTNPEQRVRSFYDIRSNNPQIEAIKEKLKPLNPIALYQNSSRSNVATPASATAPALAAAFAYGGTAPKSKYRKGGIHIKKKTGGSSRNTVGAK